MRSYNFIKLKFLLDFIQQDLSSLDEPGKEVLSRQIFTLVHMNSFSVFQSSGEVDDYFSDLALNNPITQDRLRKEQPDFIEALPEIQSGLSIALKNLIRAIDRAKTSYQDGELPLWEELEDIDITIQARCLLEGPGNTKDGLFLPYTEIENLNRIGKLAHSTLQTTLNTRGKPFAERRIIWNYRISSSLTNIVLFHFLYSLHNLPISAVYQCPECSKWFVHTTKRLKTYCSNNCAAKSGVKRNRAAKKANDPARYNKELKDGATRARSSYVRKQKRTNKNAIVKKRPTKYKDNTDGS